MNKYSKVAITLHWLIALAIIGMFFLGWYMTGLPKKAPDQAAVDLFDWGIYTWQLGEPGSIRSFYFGLHKSLGLTILALVLFRVYWRISHKPPALLASYKAWERKVATSTHHLFYALMVLIPLSGIVMAVASKYGLKWFGIKLIAGLDNNPLRESFVEVHEVLGWLMLALLALHVLGALKHAFIDKDGTLKRMSFFK